MLHIDKGQEPPWLTEFRKRNPKATYSSKKFDPYKGRLKETLIREQKCLCAYCCGRIDMNSSHNEHIEPQNPGTYSSKNTLNYGNIVASCMGFKGGETCGIHKSNHYDETQFISPLNPECEDTFTYYPDGLMDGNEYTIDLLNLNFYGLKEARKAYIGHHV